MALLDCKVASFTVLGSFLLSFYLNRKRRTVCILWWRSVSLCHSACLWDELVFSSSSAMAVIWVIIFKRDICSVKTPLRSFFDKSVRRSSSVPPLIVVRRLAAALRACHEHNVVCDRETPSICFSKVVCRFIVIWNLRIFSYPIRIRAIRVFRISSWRSLILALLDFSPKVSWLALCVVHRCTWLPKWSDRCNTMAKQIFGRSERSCINAWQAKLPFKHRRLWHWKASTNARSI